MRPCGRVVVRGAQPAAGARNDRAAAFWDGLVGQGIMPFPHTIPLPTDEDQAVCTPAAPVSTACKVPASSLARSLVQTSTSRIVRDTKARAFR